jgi:hypothetical protein
MLLANRLEVTGKSLPCGQFVERQAGRVHSVHGDIFSQQRLHSMDFHMQMCRRTQWKGSGVGRIRMILNVQVRSWPEVLATHHESRNKPKYKEFDSIHGNFK